jgi:hypothetical protein
MRIFRDSDAEDPSAWVQAGPAARRRALCAAQVRTSARAHALRSEYPTVKLIQMLCGFQTAGIPVNVIAVFRRAGLRADGTGRRRLSAVTLAGTQTTEGWHWHQSKQRILVNQAPSEAWRSKGPATALHSASSFKSMCRCSHQDLGLPSIVSIWSVRLLRLRLIDSICPSTLKSCVCGCLS